MVQFSGVFVLESSVASFLCRHTVDVGQKFCTGAVIIKLHSPGYLIFKVYKPTFVTQVNSLFYRENRYLSFASTL